MGELREQLLRAEEGRTRGGELEREWELVQPKAEFAHCLAWREGGIDGAGAGDEERLPVAGGERGHRVGLLAGDAQALPACDEHARFGQAPTSSASSGAAPTTCSKLSRRQSIALSEMCSARPFVEPSV